MQNSDEPGRKKLKNDTTFDLDALVARLNNNPNDVEALQQIANIRGDRADALTALGYHSKPLPFSCATKNLEPVYRELSDTSMDEDTDEEDDETSEDEDELDRQHQDNMFNLSRQQVRIY
jgi:hypothetical protein